MKYPSYIPIVVREFISAALDGKPVPRGDPTSPYLQSLLAGSYRGLIANKDDTKNKVTEFKQRIHSARGKQPDSEIKALEEHHEWLCLHLAEIEMEVKLLERLACDERMRDAYVHLARAFDHEEQWRAS
jgi:hypothetical protein